MKTALEAWKKSVETNVQNLSSLVANYLTTRNAAQVKDIHEQVKTVVNLFGGPGVAPGQFQGITNALDTQQTNPAVPDLFLRLVNAFQLVQNTPLFSEDQALPSFDQIFASYKKDTELQTLVEELAATLQKIIDEGDDHLTAHIVRELETILGQLKKEGQSFYELKTWADLAIRGAIMAAEVHTGTHGFNLAWEAVKLGYKVRGHILGKYAESEQKLISQHKLTAIEKAVSQHPALPSEEECRKLLPTPIQTDGRPALEGEG